MLKLRDTFRYDWISQRAYLCRVFESYSLTFDGLDTHDMIDVIAQIMVAEMFPEADRERLLEKLRSEYSQGELK